MTKNKTKKYILYAIIFVIAILAAFIYLNKNYIDNYYEYINKETIKDKEDGWSYIDDINKEISNDANNIVKEIINNPTTNEEKNIKEIFNYYQSIGYIVVTNNDIKEIKKLITGKIVVFAGQSGAGKSSLLNKLDKNLNLETNEISKALGRGKHTTRCTTLYDIDSSLVADTPGFSSVDFRGMTKIDIRDNMKEMFDNLHNCKYKDCMHIKEDDCEVKRLVEQNKILLSRYNNYKSFIGGQK